MNLLFCSDNMYSKQISVDLIEKHFECLQKQTQQARPMLKLTGSPPVVGRRNSDWFQCLLIMKSG